MVEKDTGKPTERTGKPRGGFYIISEIDGYRSPLTDKWVGCRRERREEMKRKNVREVDPSEKDTVARMRDV